MPKSNSKIRALDDKSFDILCNKPVKKVLKTSRLKKKKKSGVEGQKSFGKFEVILESPGAKDTPNYEALRKVIYDQRDLIEEKEKEKNMLSK